MKREKKGVRESDTHACFRRKTEREKETHTGMGRGQKEVWMMVFSGLLAVSSMHSNFVTFQG